MPAASAMPAKGTPRAEKKYRRESSKSSGDTLIPPLRAVRIAAIGKERNGEERKENEWNGEERNGMEGKGEETKGKER